MSRRQTRLEVKGDAVGVVHARGCVTLDLDTLCGQRDDASRTVYEDSRRKVTCNLCLVVAEELLESLWAAGLR